LTLKPEILLDTISRHPGRTAKELLKILSAEGLNGSPKMSPKQLNREYLYKNPKLTYVEQRHNGPRLWYVDETYRQNRAETPDTFAKPATPSSGLSLYPWQTEAFTWWQNRNYSGVVEAVTGAGKTRLAMAATEIQLRRNQPIVVVVPTVELMHQWKKEFERLILGELGMSVSVGFLGDNRKDSLDEHEILISTPHSGSRHYLLPEGSNGLLIADEVHRYGSTTWSRTLEDDFDRRLGLTATYERGDTGVEDFLDPYFGDEFLASITKGR
jgi:superfamily II DNA or RNA helicase